MRNDQTILMYLIGEQQEYSLKYLHLWFENVLNWDVLCNIY